MVSTFNSKGFRHVSWFFLNAFYSVFELHLLHNAQKSNKITFKLNKKGGAFSYFFSAVPRARPWYCVFVYWPKALGAARRAAFCRPPQAASIVL
jgi:hypothetical protein